MPFAAGGGNDLLARLVAEGLGKRLGQSFVTLNRPGGNTNTGTLQVVKSPPDGHSLAMGPSGSRPTIRSTASSFDPLRDLAPITLIATSPTLLVVPPDLPGELSGGVHRASESHPGALNYASYGAGTSPHLAAELFRSLTGVDIVHVPYSGGGPATVGVMGNTVQMLFASMLPVLGLIRGGKLKGIAIASDRRSPLLPDVPTFQESGLDYRTGTWFGLLAPARTPEGIVATLHRNAAECAAGARGARPDRRAGRRGDRQYTGRIPGLPQRGDGTACRSSSAMRICSSIEGTSSWPTRSSPAGSRPTASGCNRRRSRRRARSSDFSRSANARVSSRT